MIGDLFSVIVRPTSTCKMYFEALDTIYCTGFLHSKGAFKMRQSVSAPLSCSFLVPRCFDLSSYKVLLGVVVNPICRI